MQASAAGPRDAAPWREEGEEGPGSVNPPSRSASQRDDWGDEEEEVQGGPGREVRRGASIGGRRENGDSSRGGRGSGDGGRGSPRSFREEDGNHGSGATGRGGSGEGARSGFGAARSSLFGQTDTRGRGSNENPGPRYGRQRDDEGSRYGGRGGSAQGEGRPAASWRENGPSERSGPRSTYAAGPGSSQTTMASVSAAPASASAVAAAYAASRPAAAKPLPLPVVRERDSDKGTFFHGASFRGSGASAEVVAALAAIGITKPSHVQVWTCKM